VVAAPRGTDRPGAAAAPRPVQRDGGRRKHSSCRTVENSRRPICRPALRAPSPYRGDCGPRVLERSVLHASPRSNACRVPWFDKEAPPAASSLLDPGGCGTLGLSGRSRAGHDVVRAIESLQTCRSRRVERLCATQRRRPSPVQRDAGGCQFGTAAIPANRPSRCQSGIALSRKCGGPATSPGKTLVCGPAVSRQILRRTLCFPRLPPVPGGIMPGPGRLKNLSAAGPQNSPPMTNT
jgi:hypothetical protein